MKRTIGSLLLAGTLSACSGSEPVVDLAFVPQDSPTDVGLRGLTVVDARTAWVGGPDGTVLRTIDGGANWQAFQIGAAAEMDLRSAHGFNGDRAVFITAGSPAQIYRTRDGGQSFALIHQDPSEAAFYDSLAFWDDRNGIAFSDPVEGVFRILLTGDGGDSWQIAANTPEPLEGEAGFAASNMSIALGPEGSAWIGTGGGTPARLLSTEDFGTSWSVHDTPLGSGDSGSGIFSVAHEDGQILIVGGTWTEADNPDGTSAWSKNGGADWYMPEAPLSGYRSGVAAVPGQAGHFVAVGPNGSDLTRDGGVTWERISDTGYHAIAFAPGDTVGWAVGSDGRISRVHVTTE